MFDDFFRALGQLSDPRFRNVLLKGLGLTVGLLAAITIAMTWLVGFLVPDTLSLPFVGEISWVNGLALWASILLMLVLSVVLMVPVAGGVYWSVSGRGRRRGRGQALSAPAAQPGDVDPERHPREPWLFRRDCRREPDRPDPVLLCGSAGSDPVLRGERLPSGTRILHHGGHAQDAPRRRPRPAPPP